MLNINEVFLWLEKTDGQVTNAILTDLINGHSVFRSEAKESYEQYKGKLLPIQSRTLPNVNKTNRKLVNDFRSEIVDQINSYLFGKPIVYSLDNSIYGEDEDEYKRNLDVIKDFTIFNNIAKLDQELGKMSSICGTAGRLLYIDKQGKPAAMNVNPWECIFINDPATGLPQYAMRYYTLEYVNESKIITKIEWYDHRTVTYYTDDGTMNFHLDSDYEINPKPHLFGMIPLIEFPNNEERIGDTEKVEELIDAYDLLISDSQNELEEFRSAYMLFKGVEPTKEVVMAAKQTGGFGLPEGADISFLTKTLDMDAVEKHKDTLKKNIYRFSKSIDYSDDFFNSASGIALKYKLLNLDSKSIIKERAFTYSLSQMFECLSNIWNILGYQIDSDDIYTTFTRNLPINVTEEIDNNVKLKGLVSEKTRLSMLSFVDDPEWELEQMLLEKQSDPSSEKVIINKDNQDTKDNISMTDGQMTMDNEIK